MAYEMKDLTGSLWKNQKKATDRHPDRTGSALIDGVEYWVSGWIKESPKGEKWLSLAFKRKDAQKQSEPDRVPDSPAQSTDMSDEIPF